MDGLALLCNLFADGPVTLERLRAAGVAGLAPLARVEPAELAAWLHASVPQARAFALEARKLEARLGGLRAERERASAPITAGASHSTREPAVVAAVRAFVPRAPATPSSAPLRPGLVEGLDEFVCARLAEHGVLTAQRLIESAGLTLARRTGIPYSRLLALSREVRRATSTAPTRVAAHELREVDLVPRRAMLAPPRPTTLGVPDPVRSDEFTVPLAPDTDVAGPFV